MKKRTAEKTVATKKAPAKKGAAAAEKEPADGDVIETHEKVQLWKNGPYWAAANIGAGKPEDFGNYFWWGDIVGCRRKKNKWVATDGSSSNFSFEYSSTPTQDTPTRPNIDYLKDAGWISSNCVLAPEHDVAHVQWGGGWRKPTDQEFKDLVNKCVWTWTTQNGVN